MRLFFLAITCSLLAIGCRSNPSNQKEIVELRQEILDWEEYSFINEADLQRLRQENSELQDQLDNQKPETDSPLPEEMQDGGKTDQSDSTQPRRDSATIGQVAYNAEIPTLAPPEPALRIKRAESISVYSAPTIGINLDKIDGDEGVEIFITPQDESGETVHSDGELTVSLIDPTASPERQRIGLWKFVPEETKLFFAKNPSGERGILLHLPWEQSIPINSSLDLHVRLVTSDGRSLKTKHQLTITPPAAEYSVDHSAIRRWTREDPRWLPASGESDVVEEALEESKPIANKAWTTSKQQPAKIKKPTPKTKNPPPVIPAKPTWSPVRN